MPGRPSQLLMCWLSCKRKPSTCRALTHPCCLPPEVGEDGRLPKSRRPHTGRRCPTPMQPGNLHPRLPSTPFATFPAMSCAMHVRSAKAPTESRLALTYTIAHPPCTTSPAEHLACCSWVQTHPVHVRQRQMPLPPASLPPITQTTHLYHAAGAAAAAVRHARMRSANIRSIDHLGLAETPIDDVARPHSSGPRCLAAARRASAVLMVERRVSRRQPWPSTCGHRRGRR